MDMNEWGTTHGEWLHKTWDEWPSQPFSQEEGNQNKQKSIQLETKLF